MARTAGGCPEALDGPLLIESANSFATGAGLASSASGLCALSLALATRAALQPLRSADSAAAFSVCCVDYRC